MKNQPNVVTLTLNPAIDQSLIIPGFQAGEVNRVESEQSDPGGKGVNVSCFLADLGVASTACGLLGIENSIMFEGMFLQKSISDAFVRLPGKTRVNIKIIDDKQHRITDVNFPGPVVRASDLQLLNSKLESLIAHHDWFVLSGSLPDGVPVDFYHDLILKLKHAGKKVLLDTSGPALAASLSAKPHVLKPNIVELEELLGKPLTSEKAVVSAARELIAGGIEKVVVSMGEQGAIFADSKQCLLAHLPATVVKSTVGAGDAMVAGLIASTQRNMLMADCARLATASAVGTLAELGPRLPAAAIIKSHVRQVTLREIP